jgi:hypothetical protein
MIPLHMLDQSYDEFVRCGFAHTVPMLGGEHIAPVLSEGTAEPVRPFLLWFPLGFYAVREALEVIGWTFAKRRCSFAGKV